MKKLAFCLSTVVAALSLSSCSLLLSGLFGGGGWGGSDNPSLPFAEYTVNADSEKYYYFVQYNKTDTVIQRKNAAYATTSSERRSAADSEYDLDAIIKAQELAMIDQNAVTVIDGEDIVSTALDFSTLRSDNTELDRMFEKQRNEMFLNLSRSAVSANYGASTQTITSSVGSTKSFYILDGNERPKETTATCKYVGTNCIVWFVDNNTTRKSNGEKLINLSSTDFQNLGKKFDSISTLEEAVLGKHTYNTKTYDDIINPTDKINILVADLMYDANEKQTGGVFGYFNQADMIKNSYFINRGDATRSNDAQMIYIDSYFYTLDANAVYSTLAHEYNHLLNYVQKFVVNGQNFETWYTEMLAMLAEDMLQNKLGIWDVYSPKGRLFEVINGVKYGFIYNYNLGHRAWYSGNYVYSSYANSYAYGAYLVRNFGGFDLLTELATNPYVNEEAITKALIALGYKDAEGNYYNYEKTLEDEFAILFNNRSGESDLTLNRKIVYSKNADLYFDAIDIMKAPALYNIGTSDRPEIVQKYEDVKPYVNTANKAARRDLGLGGFDVNTVGSGLNRFYIEYPNITGYDIKLFWENAQ